MGCDIHVIVERRNGDGGWHRVPTRGYFDRPNTYGICRSDWRPLRAGEVDEPEALTIRSYNTFALLAGVRNGVGFAGIKMGKGWTPLSEPRGLPADTTYRDPYEGDGKRSEGPWLGDHSHSHATVRELLDFFERPQTSTLYGVLSLEEYEKWSARRTWGERIVPDSYCGDTSGPGVVVIEEVEKDRARTLHLAATYIGKRVHVRASWPMTAIQAAKPFYESALPWLTALGNPDEVRMVFGFDS